MARSSARFSVAFGLSVLSLGSVAQAQQETFALDQFHAAPAGDRFFGTQGGDAGGHLAPRAMLLGEYAYRPLVLYRADGDERVGNVVSDQMFLHLGAALGLWDIFSLSFDLPIAVVNEGGSPSTGAQSFASPNGASLGDLRLGARLRFVGEPDSAFQLGLSGYVWLPTGDRESFAGDGSVRGLPSLVVNGEVGKFVYAANAGIVMRAERQFAATKLGTQLSYAAGVGLLGFEKKLQVGPEAYGTTTLDNAFERDTTNLEAILGLKYQAGPMVLGAGAGPGITRGLGTPTLRAVASLAFAPRGPKVVEDLDPDRDGILTADDACPLEKGVPSDNSFEHGCPDRDSDGIFDKKDACVDVAGVANKDPKLHGCPKEKPDTDGDGILDEDDACVEVAGEKNDDPKLHGCPPDRDGDGIVDKEDACPDLKGKADPDPEKNGCPPDSDGDGIRDDKDACPNEKGKPDPDPQKNGCPSLVRVTDKEIFILQQVQFKTASDVILPASDELLQQVSEVLKEHPELKRMEVQGHTDNRGNPNYNLKLSQRRAASVVKWLSTRGGVEASRLEAKGYGLSEPMESNDSELGRQKNRRVQFKVLESSRAAGKDAP